MLSPHIYYALLFFMSIYAFLRGRSDERIAAVTCILATFATNLVYWPRGSYVDVEIGVMLVDIGALFAFTVLALRSDRFWPLWVAGLQLTTVIAHLLKSVELDLMPQAYAAAARFWVYPIFLIIVVGTFAAPADGRRPAYRCCSTEADRRRPIERQSGKIVAVPCTLREHCCQ